MGVLDKRQAASSTTTAPSSSSTSSANTAPPIIFTSEAFMSRSGHCSVVKDSVLYVFGGLIEGTHSNSKFHTFVSLNLTSGLYANPPVWQVLSDNGAVPVMNGQCILTDTHLIVVGGTPLDANLINPYATNAPITYCGLQAYSFAEQGWQSLMPQQVTPQTVFMNLNRTGHATGWFQNIGNGQPGLFVMGGIHFNATTPANDAFVISPFVIPQLGGQPIIEGTAIPSNLPPPLNNAGAAVVDDSTSILVFGGTTTGGGSPTTIWEYNPKTTSWRQLPVQLPYAMPNAKTGYVDPQQNLYIVDVSGANTKNETMIVPLGKAGLRRRDLTAAAAPSNITGASVAFDTTLNLAIVSGGSTQFDFMVFNMTSNAWFESVSIQPTTSTTAPSGTGTVSLQTGTGSAIKGQSTGFNKANLLAPIILGGVLGLLGLLGLALLVISYRHRKAAQNSKKGKGHASVAAGLWLKYGNQKQPRENEDPYSKALGGEIFLRNLEEKHGLKRAPTDRRKTGWSKYFSTGWYHSSSSNQRASASTSGTARALVNETRDHNGPYGGGWDAESRYSKASSFLSIVSVNDSKDMSNGQWDRVSWGDQRRARASNASSGVLGSTIDVPTMPTTSAFGAGGVRKI